MLPLREGEHHPNTHITQWEIPQTWWENHTSANLRYEVRLTINDADALNAAWKILATRYHAHNGQIWIGGAYLERIDPLTVDAISAGEDALDSLEWAINNDLIATITDITTTALNIRSIQERRIPLS